MKHYDKIFFALSILVLGGSLAYYFTSQPKLAETKNKVETLLSRQAKGVKWQEVVVPKLEIQAIEWSEVRPQDEDGKWFFQVFTPPKIWVDSDGKFITESPYMKEKARQAFALKYGGVSNEPYPVKYVGYMGSPKDPRIQLRNEIDGTFFTGKLNQPITMMVMGEKGKANSVDVGLTIKSFNRERVKKADNTIAERVTVVLFDKKYGKQITIYNDKPTVIQDSRRMSFILPDGKEWFVKVSGETKVAGDATYTIKSLDFDAGSAIVEMIPSNKEISPQTMEMSAKGIEPIKTSKK